MSWKTIKRSPQNAHEEDWRRPKNAPKDEDPKNFKTQESQERLKVT